MSYDAEENGSLPSVKKPAINPVLEGISRLLPGLLSILGSECEIVLHDFRDLSHSLIAIEGEITHRKVGSPLTDMILGVIRNDPDPPNLLNYLTHTADGRPLRSSTLFIRNQKKRLIGCICINRDISYWLAARGLLEEICEVQPSTFIVQKEQSESFMKDINELFNGTINEVLSTERIPVNLMDKGMKMRIVDALDKRGIFLVRGSAGKVARALNVSRYTIYNYLDELRSQAEQDKSKSANKGNGDLKGGPNQVN